jgi:hypothetical protein
MGRVPAVRAGVTTILLTLGLSLVIWVFFYIATPGAPLTARHTTVIAGLSFGAVLASRCAPIQRDLADPRHGRDDARFDLHDADRAGDAVARLRHRRSAR